MDKVEARIFQVVWIPHMNILEYEHHIPAAPWVPSMPLTADVIPKHFQELHDTTIKNHDEIHLTDDENEIHLKPKITGIRSINIGDSGWTTMINVGWFDAEGNCLHGELHKAIVDDSWHEEHIKHLESVEKTIKPELIKKPNLPK